MKRFEFTHYPWKWIGEGEGADDAAAKAAAEKEAADKEAAANEKKFSQKDLDNLINRKFAQTKTEKEGLVKQLTDLKEKSGLSEKEKTDLQAQIDALNVSMRTKEEQTAFEKKQLETKFKTEVETLSKERDTWKDRFNVTTIKRSITDAAVSAGAESPEQLVLMYSGHTRLEEEKDEGGKPTGNYLSKTKVQGLDPETKKMVVLDLPTAEVFQKMRELGWNKNLFKHGANAGTGQNPNGQGGGGRDPSKMPMPEDYPGDSEGFAKAYQAYRTEYNIDGSKKQKA